jgi:hypothetical protein
MEMSVLETVKKFSWEKVIDKLEQYLQEASAPVTSLRLQWLMNNLIKAENLE